MRLTLYFISLTLVTSTACALELPLAIHSDDNAISVIAMSPLNDHGSPIFNIGVSDRLEASVDIENQLIRVTADILAPSGEIYLPAFREFAHTVPLGSLPPGMYTLEYNLFSVYSDGDLVGKGTTSISIVPEPSTALLGAIASVGVVMWRRW